MLRAYFARPGLGSVHHEQQRICQDYIAVKLKTWYRIIQELYCQLEKLLRHPIDNTAAAELSLPDKNAKSSFNAVLQIENTDKSEVHSFTANIKLYLVLLHH